MNYGPNQQALQFRFHCADGQMHSPYVFKNLWWELNGEFFCYGDMDIDDIAHIKRNLRPDEVFQGWNEHHGTDWQQSDHPMVRIDRETITYPHREHYEKRKAAQS